MELPNKMGSAPLKGTQKLRKKNARGGRGGGGGGVERGGGKLNPVKLFFHSLWVWHRALATHARCKISCSKCKPDRTNAASKPRECLEFNPLSCVRVTARPPRRSHAALQHTGHPAANICLLLIRVWGVWVCVCAGGWEGGYCIVCQE